MKRLSKEKLTRRLSVVQILELPLCALVFFCLDSQNMQVWLVDKVRFELKYEIQKIIKGGKGLR